MKLQASQGVQEINRKQVCEKRQRPSRIHVIVVAYRPSLEIQNGVLHPSLVVFAHVLMHVWVVGADVFFCAPIGHCAKLQRWVLLLGMLELVEQREVREGDGRSMRHTRLCTNLSDLFLSTFQTHLQLHAQIKSLNREQCVDFK